MVLAPFCSTADMLTVLSLKQMIVFLFYAALALAVAPIRRRNKALSGILLLAFMGWAALVPRPMARLVSSDPDNLLIDFHSHTSYSHDGRKSFTPAANRRWHERQGFGAAFITDHNLVDGNHLISEMSASGPYTSLSGEEVSLFNTHMGVLGNADVVNHSLYDSNYSQIPVFINDMHKKGYLVVAHLPEYWREHWKEGNTDFLKWDVDGFEIVNSVPYCLDFPPDSRRQIVAHCRQKNLFITGVSDNHGWGSATAAWSAVKIPGWQTLPPELLQKTVLDRLSQKKFAAIQVLERAAYRPENAWQLLISPFINAWIFIRILGSACAISWIIWVWAVFGAQRYL
jgi:predicted metal-dependent phosphoesterase TrpH